MTRACIVRYSIIEHGEVWVQSDVVVETEDLILAERAVRARAEGGYQLDQVSLVDVIGV